MQSICERAKRPIAQRAEPIPIRRQAGRRKGGVVVHCAAGISRCREIVDRTRREPQLIMNIESLRLKFESLQQVFMTSFGTLQLFWRLPHLHMQERLSFVRDGDRILWVAQLFDGRSHITQLVGPRPPAAPT